MLLGNRKSSFQGYLRKRMRDWMDAYNGQKGCSVRVTPRRKMMTVRKDDYNWQNGYSVRVTSKRKMMTDRKDDYNGLNVLLQKEG